MCINLFIFFTKLQKLKNVPERGTWRGKDRLVSGENKSRCIGRGQKEALGVTGEFSLEFYNYFMPLDQSVINFLVGLALTMSQAEKKNGNGMKQQDDKEKEQ